MNEAAKEDNKAGLGARYSTSQIMRIVLIALLPGVIAMSWFWGLGIVYNVVLLVLFCSGTEALMAARGATSWRMAATQAQAAMGDGTTLVTAVLIAICLPPYTPVWPLIIAALAAIGLAKHAYGGTGRNIFNPAMVGFAVVLVAFPAELSIWPQVDSSVEGLTGATLLTDFRYREGMTSAEFAVTNTAVMSANRVIAFAFLIGGSALLMLRLIAWRLPVAVFVGIGLAALFGNDQGSSQSLGGIWFHAQTGGLIAAAFFVATDPVTHPADSRDQWVFGITVGVLIYAIRGQGSYPDGIAFAILLANCLTPLLERRRLHKHNQTHALTTPTRDDQEGHDTPQPIEIQQP